MAGTLDATALRKQRGTVIAQVGRFVKSASGQWEVPSQRSGGGKYFVDINKNPPTCTCLDFEKRAEPCKHIFAVQTLVARENGCTHEEPAETIPLNEDVRKRTCAKRPTYKQDWPSYNKAQTHEKSKFQVLLSDLCRGIPEPPREPGRPGRKPIRLADAVFACCFKVYLTISGRRAQTDLDAAHAAGFLSRGVRYNTVFDALEDPRLTPILENLIVASALPLRAVEQDFAVDSTGFTSSRFVKWFDHRYGVVRQKYDWVKCHMLIGVKTNVVAAARIGDRFSGDSPEFRPLLATTAKGFNVREVSVDSAYASAENFAAVDALGGTLYAAFKSNATGGVGGVFERMFHIYCLNRDEYLNHYHKRSNVESTASAIKAKTGDHVRSKTDTAMANEALCKVLAFNLTVLIQSQYELGIAPLFWGEEHETAPERDPACEGTPIEAWDWL